jgi:chromosome segregation ATPase
MSSKSNPADQQIPDLSHSLGQLGETTTAAELVRSKGQSKKVRVITEKKLMDWILSLINQHMASKQDAITDRDKEELLKKTQDELNRRIKREQDAQADRDRMKADLERAMAKISDAQSSAASAEQMSDAIKALKEKLEESERTKEDIQQEVYELHDQLAEKMALTSTTIAEKENLENNHRQAMKTYMMHANPLIEGVIALDNQLYGNRHNEENPVPEDASSEQEFYHDYDVGAKIIETLSNDLQRMRSIAKKAAQKDNEIANDPRMGLLESDLQLLEQLKAGSLDAVDVAEPIEGLVEAMSGVRLEAQQLEQTGKAALGVSGGRDDTILAVPEADSGSPAEVIAGTMNVARELAAVVARSRQRIDALKEMADQADEARNSAEQELDDFKSAYQKILDSIAERAVAEKIRVPMALKDPDAPTDESHKKAVEIINQLQGTKKGPDAALVIKEQLGLINTLLPAHNKTSPSAPAADADEAVLLARLRDDSAALARVVKDTTADLKRVDNERNRLAEEIGQAQSKIKQLEHQLADSNAKVQTVHTSIHKRQRTDRDIAQAVVKAAQGDEQLADAVADLALATDTDDQENIVPSLQQAITALAQRKNDLHEAHDKQKADLVAARSKVNDLEQRLLAAQQNNDKQKVAHEQTQQRTQELERDLSRVRADLDLLRNQAQDTSAKKSALEAERNKMLAQIDSLTARLTDAQNDLAKTRTAQKIAEAKNKARSETERAIATELVRAAQGDSELADSTVDFAILLEETPSSDAPVDDNVVSQQAAAAIALLADRKQALAQHNEQLKQEVDGLKLKLKEADENAKSLESERDEMAASGKEVIELLKQKNDRTSAELETIKKTSGDAQDKLARYQHRMTTAESANRQLAEALAQLAKTDEKEAGAGDLHDKYVDLELALSQLPDEGEDDVTIPDDLSLQLASSGKLLADALLGRRQQLTNSFRRAQVDQDSLKGDLQKVRDELSAAQKAIDEQKTSLRSSQAEVKAVRQELSRQGNDLANKVQELTNARGEIASIKAELDVAAQRVEEQDKRLGDTSAHLQKSQQNHERVLRELSEQQQRADALQHAQNQVLHDLRSLTNRQDAQSAAARVLTDADMADALSRAAQKLDMAQASSPEQIVSASAAYVAALKNRVQELAEDLEQKRGQLSVTKQHEQQLNSELSSLRASIVDREHDIRNLATATEKAKAEQAELFNQLIEQRRASDNVAAQAKKLQEELRLSQAENADYQARDGASSGHLSGDLQRMKTELEQLRAEREQLENALSESRERAESVDARLKAQRDEFTRRLTERDTLIESKERQINELTESRADTKGLQAQVEALHKELHVAYDRIKEFENLTGINAGANAKTIDLAKELRNLNAERDSLREKLRAAEVDLADAVSEKAQLTTQLDEKRKDIGQSKEKLMKEMTDLRDAATVVREENRKLKEELVGLRARIRRLTDTSGGNSSGGFPIKP